MKSIYTRFLTLVVMLVAALSVNAQNVFSEYEDNKYAITTEPSNVNTACGGDVLLLDNDDLKVETAINGCVVNWSLNKVTPHFADAKAYIGLGTTIDASAWSDATLESITNKANQWQSKLKVTPKKNGTFTCNTVPDGAKLCVVAVLDIAAGTWIANASTSDGSVIALTTELQANKEYLICGFKQNMLLYELGFAPAESAVPAEPIEAIFNWSDSTTTQTNLKTDNIFTVDGATLTFAKASGSNVPAVNKSGEIRMYTGTQLTIAAPTGLKVGRVLFYMSSGYTVDKLTYNEVALASDVWTLDTPAETVVLNATANARFKKIVVVCIADGQTLPEYIPVSIANTKETAYTVAKVKELYSAGEDLDTWVYVKGIVTEATVSLQYGNADYFIADVAGDTENDIQVYRGFGLDSVKFTAADDLVAGDEVIVYGQISSYNGAVQIAKNSKIVDIVKAQTSKVFANVAELLAYNVEGDPIEGYLTLTDAKVTFAQSNMFGATTLILEDASGAIQLAEGMMMGGAKLPDGLKTKGMVSGKLFVSVYYDSYNGLMVEPTDNTVANSEIVAAEGLVVPTVVTLAEAKAEANHLRYIKLENVTLGKNENGELCVIQGTDSLLFQPNEYMMWPYDEETYENIICADGYKWMEGFAKTAGTSEWNLACFSPSAYEENESSAVATPVAYEEVPIKDIVIAKGLASGKKDPILADTTIVCNDFSVIISAKTAEAQKDNEWNNYFGMAYRLDMYSGSITFKANEGKVFNKISFPSAPTMNPTNGRFTVDCGDVAFASSNKNTLTWTGEATQVVFTLTGTGALNLQYMNAGEKPAVSVENIASLDETAESGENATLNLTAAKVMYVNPKATYDEVYVNDGTGSILLNNIGITATAGKAITGKVYGTYNKVVNGFFSIEGNDKTAENTEVTEVEGAYVAPVISDLATYKSSRVEYANQLVTLTKVFGEWNDDDGEGWLTQGETKIYIDDKFIDLEGEIPAYIEKISGILTYHKTNGYVFCPISTDSITEGAIVADEVANIGALAEKENGAFVKLALKDAVVTFVGETYQATEAFVQDATGAVKFSGIGADTIAANKALNGHVVAQINKVEDEMTGAVVMTLKSISTTATESAFTATDYTFVAETVESLASIADAPAGYVNKLVTLIDVDIIDNWGDISLYQGEATVLVDDAYNTLGYSYVHPKKALKYSGIVTVDDSWVVIYPVGADSIEAAPLVLKEVANIAEMKALTTAEDVKLVANELKVTVSKTQVNMWGDQATTVIIEDATGAVQIETSSESAPLPEALMTAGGVYNGSLALAVDASMVEYGGGLIIGTNDSTATSALVAVEGKVAEPTVMTMVEAQKPENDYRWIKFENVETVLGEYEGYFQFSDGTDTLDQQDPWMALKYDSVYNEEYEYWETTPVVIEKYDYLTGILIASPDGYQIYPVSYKEFSPQAILNVTEDYKFIPTAENVYATDWLVAGPTTYTNKTSTIDPSTGEEKSGDYFGIGIKAKEQTNKYLFAYVTGAKEIKAFGASTGGSDRNITVEAYEWDSETQSIVGEVAATATVLSPKYTTVTPTITLDENKTYRIQYYSDADCAIYGIWFNKTITGINEVNATVNANNNVYYNLQGIRVDKPTKGLYIVNGKKVLFK